MQKDYKYGILQISQEAKEAKKISGEVVNATIGSYYNDEGKFVGYSSVKDALKNLDDEEYFSYAPSDGGKTFSKAIKDWIYGDENLDQFGFSKVIATPGGTGALMMSVYNTAKHDEYFLLPNICWENYYTMALINNSKLLKYNYIKDNHFDFNDFYEKSEIVFNNQDTYVTILNDPCNNPTGYSLTEEEFNKVIDYLNSKQDKKIVFIFDIAYFDYSFDKAATDRKLKKLLEFNANVLVIIIFSASKALSSYGLRLGAALIYSKDEEKVLQNYNQSLTFSRSHWSNCCHPGISLMNQLFINKELKLLAREELSVCSNIIKRRVTLFTKEADEVGLKYYPFNGGFFISLPTEDPIAKFELLKKQNIYVIPLDFAIRVAICSIPYDQVKGLAKKLKDIVK